MVLRVHAIRAGLVLSACRRRPCGTFILLAGVAQDHIEGQSCEVPQDEGNSGTSDLILECIDDIRCATWHRVDLAAYFMPAQIAFGQPMFNGCHWAAYDGTKGVGEKLQVFPDLRCEKFKDRFRGPTFPGSTQRATQNFIYKYSN